MNKTISKVVYDLVKHIKNEESLDDYSEPKKYNYDRMEWVKKNLSKRDNLYDIGLENLRVLVYQLGLFQGHILTDEEGIEITKDYDPSIPDLYMDSYLLEQSILNLIKNAKESLVEAGETSPKIEIHTRILHREFLGKSRHKTVCKITVLDNGPGIPENMKESIFFPMISGKNQGSGLGLSITQGIVSQHKGAVRFKSEPGRTEFSILIPIENKISEVTLRTVHG